MDLLHDWQQWREDRNDGLRDPHGWLSVIDLEWLSPQPARLRSFPGVWSAVDHVVTAVFAEGDGVSIDGRAQVGTFVFVVEQGGQDLTRTDDQNRRAEVASRFGRICVRTRDPLAPVLASFTQTNTYPFDPEWIVRGAWAPVDEPTTVTVATAQPGLTSELSVAGHAEILGQSVLVTGSADSPSVIFHDKTNGDATEEWRYAPVSISEDGLVAAVDFNRAANFPASFMPFGTCPMPPDGNSLSKQVTAGEMKNQ